MTHLDGASSWAEKRFSSCLTVWNVLLKADVKWLSLTYFREGRQGWGFPKSKLKMTEKWRALRPEPCVGSRWWLTSLRRGPSAAVRSSSVLQRPGSCRCLSGCPGSKRGEPGGIYRISAGGADFHTGGGAHLWDLLWVHLQGEVLKGLHSGLTRFGWCHKYTAGKRHAVVIPAEKMV